MQIPPQTKRFFARTSQPHFPLQQTPVLNAHQPKKKEQAQSSKGTKSKIPPAA